MASVKVSLLYSGTVSGETKEKALESIQSFIDNPLLRLCNGSEYLRDETTTEVVNEDSDLTFSDAATIIQMLSFEINIVLHFDVDIEHACDNSDIYEVVADEINYYEKFAPKGFEFIDYEVEDIYSLDEEEYGNGGLDPAFSSWYEVNCMFV